MTLRSPHKRLAKLTPRLVLAAAGWLSLGLLYVTARSIVTAVLDWISERDLPWPPKRRDEWVRIEPSLFSHR